MAECGFACLSARRRSVLVLIGADDTHSRCAGQRLTRIVLIRDGIHLCERQSYRFADVANRRARMIRHDLGSHCSVRAPVTIVNVLEDLLAILMGEINVDIGNLLPPFGHEPFEEQFHSDRIDGRNAERVTDRAIRRRTAALAKHAHLICRAHDVPHDQKVAGQIHLCDHAEFVFQLPLDVRGERRTVPLGRTAIHQFAQVALPRIPFGHGEKRELSGQTIQTKRATFRDNERIANGQGIAAEDLCHHPRRFQMILGVWPQQRVFACLRERRLVLDAQHHVGETRMVFTCIHHAVGGNVRQFEFARNLEQLPASAAILRMQMMLQFEVQTLLEMLAQKPNPRNIGSTAERDQTLGTAGEIVIVQLRSALAAAQLPR